MGNVFQTEARMHRKFDLKGSTHGRTAGARAAAPAAILKARARCRAPQACAPAGSGRARDAFGAAAAASRAQAVSCTCTGLRLGLRGSAAARGQAQPRAQDLDLDVRLALSARAHAALMAQLAADTALLQALHVMDYSLLLGLHFPRWGADRWRPPHAPAARSPRPLVQIWPCRRLVDQLPARLAPPR